MQRRIHTFNAFQYRHLQKKVVSMKMAFGGKFGFLEQNNFNLHLFYC